MKQNAIWDDERRNYCEIDARVIGTPEDIMVHHHKVARDCVALVKHVIVHAFNIVDCYR